MAEVPGSSSDETRILLPRFVVLKSKYNNRCLRLTENDGSLPAGFLKFEESEEVEDEQANFELEPAKSESGKRLVHIRCCYNNKYLVIVDTPMLSCTSGWIVAAADKPEEDESKISCTLFELDPVNISQGRLEFRFLHVHLGIHACFWTCSTKAHSRFYGGLHGGSGAPDRDMFNVYTLVPWEVCVDHMRRVQELEEAALLMSQQQMRRVQELEEAALMSQQQMRMVQELEEAALLMSQLLF